MSLLNFFPTKQHAKGSGNVKYRKNENFIFADYNLLDNAQFVGNDLGLRVYTGIFWYYCVVFLCASKELLILCMRAESDSGGPETDETAQKWLLNQGY